MHKRTVAGMSGMMLAGLLSLETTGGRALAQTPAPVPEPAPATAQPKSPPNIIFILADDMGYGDFNFLSHGPVATPNLDRLAAQGMVFTQSYCGSTVSAPSRACLMTGQHTGHVWQRGNADAIAFRPDPADITIATLLKQAGYHTAMIGKSALACNGRDAQLILEKGFDRFYGQTSHGAAHRHYPTFVFDQNKKIALKGNHGTDGDSYNDELALAQALDWLRQQKSGPFFLHLALTDPHADLIVPDPYRAPYIGKFNEPETAGRAHVYPNPLANYAGMVNLVDQAAGKIVAELQALGIADNTIVFFASDNGPENIGGKKYTDLGSNSPFRGGKRDLYEGGIRTPLIVYWPGTIAPGQQTQQITAFWDFAPTALTLAGLPVPSDMDGVSLVPTLLGQGEQKQHPYLYWEFYEKGGKQAVRLGDWKGVRLDVGKDPNGPIELYDLASDITESNNVAAAHPDVVAQIAKIMDEAHAPTPVFSFEKNYIGPPQ